MSCRHPWRRSDSLTPILMVSALTPTDRVLALIGAHELSESNRFGLREVSGPLPVPGLRSVPNTVPEKISAGRPCSTHAELTPSIR